MKHDPAVRVVKRDGTVETFEPAKLRRCLAIGMKACDHRAGLANDLVRAMEMHLRDCSAGRALKSDYIFRCARTVLRETGLPEVAKVLDSFRRHRATCREQVRVFSEKREDQSLKKWRKTCLVNTLVRDFGVSGSTARVLAGEVEQRVLMLGYGAVSTGLISELIRTELRCWGLSLDALRVAPSTPRPKEPAELKESQ